MSDLLMYHSGANMMEKTILDDSNMLTVHEVVFILNIHINTVRRWSNLGILKSYRVDTRHDRRFKPEDIDNLLRSD
jgi:hypothetical protein